MYDAYDSVEGEYDPYSYHESGYGLHTGDPREDLEYEKRYGQSHKIQEPVKNFLLYLQKAIHEVNVFEIQNLYENSYVKLTDRCFKTSPWPEATDVAVIVQNDGVFLTLYKELYYRHIYAKVASGPNVAERCASYYNYCDLFNYILNAEGPVPLELPNQWLWDTIDEFIYQFQSFCQFRSKLNSKHTNEIAQIQENPKVWNVHSVLNVLHSLVDKSNINCQLEIYTSGGDPDSVAGDFGRHPLYKMLGYFSLVGLLRLHSLLGDYYQAIKVLENIELNKKNLYSRVPACQVTTYYYVGFAYMMMRRYADAIRTFSDILLYVQRTRQIIQHKTYQVDQMNKQTEQMYSLLTICLVLYPQQIDESIMSYLKENLGEKMQRMQRGDYKEFENCFGFACPKFLAPVPPVIPNYENNEINEKQQNLHMEPYMQQLKVFMDEVQQQLTLPIIRSYLKLYTTMPISKLAGFINTTESLLCADLLCFKHKMKNIIWIKGATGLEGEFQSGSEVDFYIDNEMIHIADTKVAQRYGDFFIRQIHKFEDLYQAVANLPV